MINVIGECLKELHFEVGERKLIAGSSPAVSTKQDYVRRGEMVNTPKSERTVVSQKLVANII